MNTYSGSCHCQAVQFEVSCTLDRTMTCNCSMCRRSGAVHVFVPAEQFSLTSGETVLSSYHFHKKIIDHLFCSVCGVRAFATGKGHDGEDTVAVNVRCLPDVDLSTLDPIEYDGASV